VAVRARARLGRRLLAERRRGWTSTEQAQGWRAVPLPGIPCGDLWASLPRGAAADLSPPEAQWWARRMAWHEAQVKPLVPGWLARLGVGADIVLSFRQAD
jgi:hypothetical protein